MAVKKTETGGGGGGGSIPQKKLFTTPSPGIRKL